ncbi:MAG: hypothetical protein AAF908_12705, partial [Pseudomonadota bacterium]
EVTRVCARAARPTHLKDRLDFREAAERAALLDPPRGEITPRALFDYVDDGPSEMGAAEVAYFLPRICEILADGQHLGGSLGWEVSLGCLSRSRFPATWPDDRVAAIQRFTEELVADFAQNPARFPDGGLVGPPCLGDFLEMAARGGIDLTALTERLRRLPSADQTRCLARWEDHASHTDLSGAIDAWRAARQP